MGEVDIDLIPISSMSDSDIKEFIKKNSLALKVSECREIAKLIGRDPRRIE